MDGIKILFDGKLITENEIDDKIGKRRNLEKLIETILSKASKPQLGDQSHITQLFSSFLEGPIKERSLQEIFETVNPPLKIFENNPSHLRWANEIAKNYLDGCVNQPVAGFCEIAAMAQITRAQGVRNKLESAKQLLSLNLLRSFALNLARKERIGAETEIEFSNAPLREIHKKLHGRGWASNLENHPLKLN